MTRPPAKYAPNGGWLSKVGAFTVERIDEASSLRAFSDHTTPPNKFLLHTIEGLWPALGDWEVGRNTLNTNGFFPHFLVGKDKSGVMRIGQFVSTQQQSRACKAPGNAGTIQVEIGGRAATPFAPNDPELTEAVRTLFQAVRLVFPAIANAAPRAFVGSASGAGTTAASRVPDALWNSLSGLVGHQHAPANDVRLPLSAPATQRRASARAALGSGRHRSYAAVRRQRQRCASHRFFDEKGGEWRGCESKHVRLPARPPAVPNGGGVSPTPVPPTKAGTSSSNGGGGGTTTTQSPDGDGVPCLFDGQEVGIRRRSSSISASSL